MTTVGCDPHHEFLVSVHFLFPNAYSYTIENNLKATHNVLCAIVESSLDIHLVHLGTMGVYGYGNSGGEIPEGYIDVVLPGNREKKILHPAYPGSIYHTTKCLDALLFQFYQKNDRLRLTDLHQVCSSQGDRVGKSSKAVALCCGVSPTLIHVPVPVPVPVPDIVPRLLPPCRSISCRESSGGQTPRSPPRTHD